MAILTNSFTLRSLTPMIVGGLLCSGIFSCQTESQKVSYNKDIRPILNENCLTCHGGIKQLGEFSLLFEEDVYQTTESGKPAIVPGSKNKSELFKRISHGDPEYRMPQDADPLSAEQIKIIGKWIDEGAVWEAHWSFQAPEVQEIPDVSSNWAINNIDAFILERLEQEGLSPQPEAERETLVRRLSLDLIGLPPTPEEVDNFLSDKSPEAYEHLVDGLMESQHYGEKWAAWWLDLARYADSKGYEKDPPRSIWRYRDWVINAFNRDMPFDQFTIEQLAGDLMDDPAPQQLIATAFNRNSMTNTEGGTEDEEFRAVAVIDRVNTTFEVWQSLTIGCVQCHDHPYDPIRHEEYYQAFAFFNTTQDSDLMLDVPLYLHYSDKDTKKIKETIERISTIKRQPNPDPNQLVSDQIKVALFPTLLPEYVDEFHNVILYPDGLLSNWSNNVNTQKEKDFYFKFKNIDLTGIESIRLNFSGSPDVKLVVFLDSLGGDILVEMQLPYSGGVRGAEYTAKNIFMEKFWAIEIPVKGLHHLIFQMINTTGEVPDGVAMIREINLEYRNSEDKNSKELQRLQDELKELRLKADQTPIMKDRSDFIRTTHVFERGNWMVPGEQVQIGVPSSLPEFTEDFSQDRMGLAKWMVSDQNPLTGRVLVNRLWEQLFGIGIVETVEDFGTQGSSPSHPELMDYLARQALDIHYWSVKSILKEIVMSAAYRQSSKITTKKLEIDPYNRLLSRGPRFRLSAEQIRDQSLAVSGLLDRKVGGKSVMPPQPDGIWNVVYSDHKWETKPEDKYRRAIYTFWRRTTPYPSMVSFDSPSREFCVSRRIRTNTPLQALITLNDPVYLETSIALAKRMIKAAPNDAKQAIQVGYKIALSNEPDNETVEILMDLYHIANTELKGELVSSGEYQSNQMDAMSVVANAIMNLDQFVTKE